MTRTIVNCRKCEASVLVVEFDEQACCGDSVKLAEEVSRRIKAAGWAPLEGGGHVCTECK